MINRNKLRGLFSGAAFAVTFCILISGFNVFAEQKDIPASYDGIKTYVDGELTQPRDSKGKIAEPFTADGYVYLPIETVCRLLGEEFSWDAANNSIYFGKRPVVKIQEVTVSNADELYNQLGSNKKIKLKPGVYNLSKVKQSIGVKKNVYWEDVYDGKELVFSDIENLTLEGLGDKPAEIVVEPRYADVLNFIGCSNISINNIKAGHTIDKGDCDGGVLKIDSSTDINISDSIFYGCGTLGINAVNSENLKFVNSVIEECSYGIMQLDSCKNFMFTDSIFRKCQGFNMIDIISSTDMVFDKCEFSENTVCYDYSAFLNSDLSYGVKFLNCKFKNNVFNNFGNNLADIDFTGSAFEGNSLFIAKRAELQ
ncbi:parallel beta helix pectate lyase-like protein [Ruminiclostridium sufflavum DSM 19573]|uniref:Parallel beta helix pectate lyase-like protein n=1 Tax=Ruminiclostridium sufflavum DSM 19573 TaxID=1121337 RepID=A0A318XJF9_9FIRM|nr:right-handed parallel beta-helix repeat-containing protein [Ruminiclostridium sufflavum]PYG87340.1 parallel beta helix pectate lyase-like protein [Ruminiclostridium sufflavum DSM 19573]